MKKYMVIQKETLVKMLECFVDEEEFRQYGNDMSITIDEILFTSQLAFRNIEDADYVAAMTLKQYFMLALFFKNNMEIIRELVNVIEYDEITEDEKQRLDKENPKGDLDGRKA